MSNFSKKIFLELDIYICVCVWLLYIYMIIIYIIGHLDDEERGKMIIHGKSMKSQKKPMSEAVPLMVLLVGNNGNIKKKYGDRSKPTICTIFGGF